MKSVQEYSAKVEQLGGKVISPKHPVPGMVILQYAQIQRIMALVFLKPIKLLNEESLVIASNLNIICGY